VGFLAVFGRANADTREVRLALAAAALAASIEALRAHAATEAQTGALTNLVNDWIGGRFERPDELSVRARQLGQALAPPYAVVIVERDAPLRESEARRRARAPTTGGPEPDARPAAPRAAPVAPPG